MVNGMSFTDGADLLRLALPQEPPIAEMAREYSQLIEGFRNLDPVLTAAKFGALLALPELHANCIRLEALVHLAIAYGGGQESLTDALVEQSFDRLDQGYCGRMEDPAEDVFTALVNTSQGNFRIFQGGRESPGFFLQRFLNVVETMPDRGPFQRLQESIRALLKISDAIAQRAGVAENNLGSEMPAATFPADLKNRLGGITDLVRFTDRDLAELGISKESLSEFLFPLEANAELRSQIIGNSSLERRPVAAYQGSYLVLLPTAISTAISRLVIETVSSLGRTEPFESILASEYARLIYESSFLGKRLNEPPRFQKIPGGGIASLMAEFDPGRFLQVVLFLDGLDGFEEDGFAGANAAPEALAKVVASFLARASAEAKEQPSFLEGLTLVVSCGYGRGFVLPLEQGPPDRWRLEFLGSHDLNTLNWLPGFDALSLLRLLDAREAVEQEGIELLNVNGLLNLVAWSRQLDGHLIPHGQVPKEFGEPGTKNLVVVDQNAIRGLRHEVATQWSPRRVLDSDGRWVRVLKVDASPFEDERRVPFYASDEDVHRGKLRGVYVAPGRPWWIEIATPDSTPRDAIFQHWSMLTIWLRRAVPVLESAYPSLPDSPISFRVSFEEIVGVTSGEVIPKTLPELRSLVAVSTDAGARKIDIVVGRGFHEGFFQPENVAERALVEALVLGAATLAGENGDPDNINRLVERICPNPRARYIHRYQGRSFRDYASEKLRETPTLIDKLDDATFRIGLGWKVRSREGGADVTGIKECTSCLNDVVGVVLDSLCTLLRSLDRGSFVDHVLRNHEAAAHDRDVWKRTTEAVLALHDDQNATIRTIVQHEAQINSCFTASRILLEAAICECPVQGGRTPGTLDLARAMALALEAHHYGGWSDAIHWGAIEPYVRITPLGDIHIKHHFIETVFEPFGRAVGEVNVEHDAKSYPALYRPIDILPSVSTLLESDFLNAWQAEFHVSIDGLRFFLSQLEKVDARPVEPIRTYLRSTLARTLADSAGVSETTASECLDLLTLPSRPAWRTTGAPYVEKDWVPWRFRRRLSVLRRPFIAIDNESDATIVVAPALVADALYAQMRSFHSGEVPSWQIRSREMRKWIGRANHLHRTAFNTKVAERMRELGWQAEAETKVTKILRQSLDRDYGDVDVLAWKPRTGRVLAIECKDLQFNKTMGEVAEQLADFRGLLGPDGKRDALRRHLDRVEILAAHPAEIAKALPLAAPAQIEGHLVFKNPVPMRFAWKRMTTTIKLSLVAELDEL
jgi:hypothetical protein